jgi:hypothetical protein
VTGEEGAAPLRETGWWGPILATLALLILPATPLLRIVMPVDQTILLLAPALAACAVAGWRAGGRLPLALFWSAFAAWVLFQSTGAAGAFGLLARGWAAILAASFGALVLGGVGERFLPRALLALAVALVVGGLVAVIGSGGLTAAYDLFSAEVARRADLSQTQWREMSSSLEWEEFVRGSPGAQGMQAEVERQLAVLPDIARRIFPALLLLQSLAALALAWAVYHRIGRARLGPPLARWRELRFHDALIWGVVAGLVLLALPTTGMLRGVGLNLLVFLGALYALRGAGVIIWFLAPGRWMTVFLAVFALFFWYVVGVVAVGIGLGDTWLDWRRRLRPKSQRSE